jgi:hypothetical protein
MARVLEGYGIATVCVLSRPDLAGMVKAPRALIARFPYGAPLGVPGNTQMQLDVVHEALDLLVIAKETATIAESAHRWKAT